MQEIEPQFKTTMENIQTQIEKIAPQKTQTVLLAYVRRTISQLNTIDVEIVTDKFKEDEINDNFVIYNVQIAPAITLYGSTYTATAPRINSYCLITKIGARESNNWYSILANDTNRITIDANSININIGRNINIENVDIISIKGRYEQGDIGGEESVQINVASLLLEIRDNTQLYNFALMNNNGIDFNTMLGHITIGQGSISVIEAVIQAEGVRNLFAKLALQATIFDLMWQMFPIISRGVLDDSHIVNTVAPVYYKWLYVKPNRTIEDMEITDADIRFMFLDPLFDVLAEYNNFLTQVTTNRKTYYDWLFEETADISYVNSVRERLLSMRVYPSYTPGGTSLKTIVGKYGTPELALNLYKSGMIAPFLYRSIDGTIPEMTEVRNRVLSMLNGGLIDINTFLTAVVKLLPTDDKSVFYTGMLGFVLSLGALTFTRYVNTPSINENNIYGEIIATNTNGIDFSPQIGIYELSNFLNAIFNSLNRYAFTVKQGEVPVVLGDSLNNIMNDMLTMLKRWEVLVTTTVGPPPVIVPTEILAPDVYYIDVETKINSLLPRQ